MQKPLSLRRSSGSAMLAFALAGEPASPSIRISLQHEFCGRGQGWTDTTQDTRDDVPLKFDYGIKGTGPLDRVAGIGTCNYGLNNYPDGTTGRLESAYSPGHANCRPGFGIGIGVRVALIRNVAGVETTYYKWRGTLDVIKPTPGRNQNRLVTCQAVDFMDEFSRFLMAGIPTQLGKRSNELVSTIIAAMPRQPAAVESTQGIDAFQYAFDNSSETATAMSELQRIAMSELALIYPKGDTVQGGTIVVEGRRTRGRASTNVQVFDNTMNDLAVTRSRTNVINSVRSTTHPRLATATNTTVLFALPPDNPPSIAPGSTFSTRGSFRDPNQTSARVGGIDMQPLLAGTDYVLNTAADGSGSDVTSSCTVSAQFDGNSAVFTVINNTTQTVYLRTLQCRGRGLLDFSQMVLSAADASSQAIYGQNVAQMDMTYQSDPVVGQGAAYYVLGLYKDALTMIDRFGFLANSSDDLMTAMLTREISDRIGVREDITGLTDVISGSLATRGFFINSVAITVGKGPTFTCTWALQPADQNAYWKIGIPGLSEISLTTRLGWGLFQEHIDVAHSDVHADVAHLDVSHGDSHTDTHTDDLHGDTSGHGDSHTDTPHSDTAHSDVALVNTHNDVTHVDTAHADSHQDSAHVDGHSDIAHGDFNDISHSDHDDVTLHDDVNSSLHQDGAHDDSHTDTPHSDGHNDTVHSDTAHADTHGDVAHSDVNHSDVALVSSHTDTSAHNDTPHGDVAHVDVAHVDTLHSDTVHADDHQDVNHGDGFV